MKLFMKYAYLFFVLTIYVANTALAEPIDYSEQAWNEWKKDPLPEQNSWLTLVGLYWLNPGINTIGSDASNDHKFPSGTPANIGSLELKDGAVFFTRSGDNMKIKLIARLSLTIRDSPVSTLSL